jgi:hypothetical protein
MQHIVCSISSWVSIHSLWSWGHWNALNDEYLSAPFHTPHIIGCFSKWLGVRARLGLLFYLKFPQKWGSNLGELMLKDRYHSACIRNSHWKIHMSAEVTTAPKDEYLWVRKWQPRQKMSIFERGSHNRAKRWVSLSAEVTPAPKDEYLLARLWLPRSKMYGELALKDKYLSAWVLNMWHNIQHESSIHAERYISFSADWKILHKDMYLSAWVLCTCLSCNMRSQYTLKDAHRSAHSHNSKSMKNGLKLIKIYYIQYMALSMQHIVCSVSSWVSIHSLWS